MITKSERVTRILSQHPENLQPEASVFAPANIALCKYWGKRDTTLNLPVTDSLSLSLGNLGSHCHIRLHEGPRDRITLNDQMLPADHPFVSRLCTYLDLFRSDNNRFYDIRTINSIPTAAGFASSASGFAAIVKALDQLHGWQLSPREMSILARLGSGSASRSLWQGFVHWHAGHSDDGMDSYAEPIEQTWDELRIGLLVLNRTKKAVGSTEAMLRTVKTSSLYNVWPAQVTADLTAIRAAIDQRDFEALGNTSEANALTMHATMIAARPPVLYWQPESIAVMQAVWQQRSNGLPVYFTMDAGPNLKLLFRAKDQKAVTEQFPHLITANPWQNQSS